MIEQLSKVADVLNARPTSITVDIEPNSFKERVMIFLRLKRREITFEVKPIRVRNIYRIASKSVMIPNDFLEKSMNEVVLNHIEEIIYIVAVGIQNDIHEPKEDLKDFIRNNFTSNDLVKVLLIVFQSINVKDFLNSIVLIKGMNVLQDQTSLKKQEEIIAPVPGQ